MSDIAAAQWEIESLKRERQQLIRERDEVRVELANLKRKITEDWVSVSGDMPGICAEWEQRGYRRGVEDAAGAMQPMIRSMISRDAAARTILALLEQTSDTNSPHPGNGAGNVEKI